MKNQSYQDDVDIAAASLERMLFSFAVLSPGDIECIRSWFHGPAMVHPPGGAVSLHPERKDARVVARGWIARGAMLEDGRRQIVGLSLPGDVILAADVVDADMAVWALTDASTLDASLLWAAISEGVDVSPRLLEAWRHFRSAERLRLARHVIRLGRLWTGSISGSSCPGFSAPFRGMREPRSSQALRKSGAPGDLDVDQRKKLSCRRDLRRQPMLNQPLRIEAQSRQIRIADQRDSLSQRRHRRVLQPEGRGDASSATPSTG